MCLEALWLVLCRLPPTLDGTPRRVLLTISHQLMRDLLYPIARSARRTAASLPFKCSFVQALVGCPDPNQIVVRPRSFRRGRLPIRHPHERSLGTRTLADYVEQLASASG